MDSITRSTTTKTAQNLFSLLLTTLCLFSARSVFAIGTHYTYAYEAAPYGIDVKLSKPLNNNLRASVGDELLRVYRHSYPEHVYYTPTNKFSITKWKFGHKEQAKSIDFDPSQTFGRTHRIYLDGSVIDAVCIANCPENNQKKDDPVLVAIRDNGQVASARLFFFDRDSKSADKAAYYQVSMSETGEVTNDGHMTRHAIKDVKPWKPDDSNYVSIRFDGFDKRGFPVLQFADHLSGRDDKITSTSINIGRYLHIKGKDNLRIIAKSSNSISYLIDNKPPRNDPYVRLSRKVTNRDFYLPGINPNRNSPAQFEGNPLYD
jgi:hypothetical protein